MKMAEISKVLVEGDQALLKQFAEEVEANHQITIIKHPGRSLVMAKTRDSVSRAPFYIGEVLVSECTVSIDQVYGLGVVMGDEPEKSYHLAVVDAALLAKLPVTEQWMERLVGAKAALDEKRRWQHAQAAKTNVDFATVEEFGDDKR